jgi:preprotein translocase subunit SecE
MPRSKQTNRMIIIVIVIIIIIIIIIILLQLGVYPVAVDLTLIQTKKDYT